MFVWVQVLNESQSWKVLWAFGARFLKFLCKFAQKIFFDVTQLGIEESLSPWTMFTAARSAAWVLHVLVWLER